MSTEKQALFDSAATSYDDEFTLSEIGLKQRNRVYYWLSESKILEHVRHIFEVNCGTGYDAENFAKQGYKVIATDASVEMIKVATNKRNENLEFYQLNFSDISTDKNIGNTDLVFSNFGGLNCLDKKELKSFFEALATKQKKGNKLALVIMPKQCLMEDLYLLFKGRFSQIGRRKRQTHIDVDVNGSKVKTFYHSPLEVKSLLLVNYTVKRVKPVAIFLPPSYLEPFFKKRVWLLNILNFLERIFGKFDFLAAKADHYIIIAERR